MFLEKKCFCKTFECTFECIEMATQVFASKSSRAAKNSASKEVGVQKLNLCATMKSLNFSQKKLIGCIFHSRLLSPYFRDEEEEPPEPRQHLGIQNPTELPAKVGLRGRELSERSKRC